MNLLTLREPIRQFADHLGLTKVVGPQELDAGLAHIEAEMQRITLDAHTAKQKGVGFAVAAGDFENFPHMARFHVGVDDLLTMGLSPKIEKWVRKMLASPEPPAFDKMRASLVAAAADTTEPTRQALCHFLLYEATRLNLVLAARWYPQETIGVGLEIGQLDELAERTVQEWLSKRPAVPSGTRPFRIIVSAALQRMTELTAELHDELQSVQRDFLDAAQKRARIEEALAKMEPAEALLIRNTPEISAVLGEQSLTVERLQGRHFLTLGQVTRNALDQRLRRARQRGAADLKRRRVALLELLRDPNAVAPSQEKVR